MPTTRAWHHPRADALPSQHGDRQRVRSEGGRRRPHDHEHHGGERSESPAAHLWSLPRIGCLRQVPAETRSNVPVIAVTADGREHSRSRVLAADFTEHLQKPVDPEELCRLVANLAGR